MTIIRERMLVPVSYRGIGLNTKGRAVFFDYEEGAFNTPQYSATTVGRTGRFPSQVRMQPDGKTFPLHISIKSPDIQGQFDAIAEIFDPVNGENTLLVRDCDGRLLRLVCTAQQIILPQRSGRPLVLPLFAADPTLQDDTLTTLLGTIDAGDNPITLTPNNLGSADALPVLHVTPTVQRTAAETWTRMREVTYANTSEFALSGPGSGTWLLEVTATQNPLAEAGWDTATLIAGGEMLASGDDIAVFVDGLKVPAERVTIADIDTAFTKIWIEIADGPALFAKNKTALTNAVLTTIEFYDSQHGFSPGEYLVFVNDAGDVEKARILSVDGPNVSVRRGVHSSAAADTVAADSQFFRSGHRIQIAWGWNAAPVRAVNPDHVPLIDTTTSVNSAWEWTGVPIWPDNNSRPGGWRRILYEGREDNPSLIKNKLSAKTALKVYLTTIGFFDVEPDAGTPNFDALEFRACCGIDSSAPSIEYDALIGWPYALQVIGRDLLGLDAIVATRMGHETGNAHFPPSIYTDQQEQPAGVLSTVILRARQMILTTCRPNDNTVQLLAEDAAVNEDAQGFHIDNTAQIIGLVGRGRMTAAAPNEGFSMTINLPDPAGGPGQVIIGPFTGAQPLDVFTIACEFPSPSAAYTTDIPVIASGDYFLMMYEDGLSGTGIEIPKSNGSIYALGAHWTLTGFAVWGEVPDEDLWFAILSLNADNQDDAVQAERTGEVLLMVNEKLTFDRNRCPFVDARPPEDAYYLDDTWTQGVDTMRLSYLKSWADAEGNEVIIDVGARLVYDVNEDNESIRQCLSPADDPWLRVRSGINAILVEAIGGAEGEDHILEFRSAWQA